MTKGALIFALNNSDIDYTKIALFAAKKIIDHLGVPVSIVTDSKESLLKNGGHFLDNIIEIAADVEYFKVFNDGVEVKKKLEWKNTSRPDCFSLSPYDETLVIDADFIINSSTLSYCWNQQSDFLIYKKSFDLAQRKHHSEFENISDYGIPFYWATVFWFRKTLETESFFNLVSYIKENWTYYKFIFRIDSNTFRNDIAYSIAIHIMNGCNQGNFAKALPGKLYYTMDRDILLGMKENSMQFLVERINSNSQYLSLKVNNLDVHVMNKYSLQRVI